MIVTLVPIRLAAACLKKKDFSSPNLARHTFVGSAATPSPPASANAMCGALYLGGELESLDEHVANTVPAEFGK